ncbi:MAG: DUF5906 domain-containing protein [Shewanella sp.]
MVVFPLTDRKTPAIEKGTSWHTYNGPVSTPMVGVAIPDGIFVIDADLYKGVTLEQIEEILGCALPWDAAELQNTMQGGRHYAFSVPMGGSLLNTKNAFGLIGFDTRSAGKGYIASGYGYELLSFMHDTTAEALDDKDCWPRLPDVALAKVTNSRVRDNSAEDETCDLLDAIAAQPLDLTIEQVRQYVERLPWETSESEDWLRVGMAIKHQLGDAGWPLFDEFSRRCPEKYDEVMNRRRWNSFKTEGKDPVTFASVIKLAGGAVATAKIEGEHIKQQLAEAADVGQLEELLKRAANLRMDKIAEEAFLKTVQAKYTALTGSKPSLPTIRKEIKTKRVSKLSGDFVDEYVYCTSAGEWMHRESKSAMKSHAFDVVNNRRTPPDNDGNKQSATTYAMDRVEPVDSTMYFPAAAETFERAGLRYLNMYRAPEIETVPVGTTDIVERVKGHIAHLLADKREQDILIDYLAHNVQNPGVKKEWAIVLQGVQGDGKSFFAEMMSHVMGSNNVRIMGVETLESPFTGWATGQCMTFIEELKLDNLRKYEVLNKLKMYVSNPTVEEHKKGKDPHTVVNTTNYIALTNFKDAIPIDTTDRRYCILFSRWQQKGALVAFKEANPGYYPELYAAMRANFGELRQWLLEHEISAEFVEASTAPDTNAKEMMTELSKSSSQIAVEEGIEHFKAQIELDDGGTIDVTWLSKLAKDASAFDDKWEDFPAKSALKNALLNAGWELVGRKRTKYSEGDNKHTIYRRG